MYFIEIPFVKVILLLFSLVLTPPDHIQDIKSGQEVVVQLSQELENLSPSSAEVFRAYSNACQELVRRGNYEIADSLFDVSVSYQKFESDSNRIMTHKSSRGFMLKVRGQFEESLKEYIDVREYYLEKKM